ncbi:hypothetical protein BT93_C1811 [Corymbia citriodora subsp. variegata]|nr:hypothetical protein BT93_C1811 [Corymbia citriodora subsp. variegata]
MIYFQSPLHPHILFLRNLSPHFPTDLDCKFCSKSIDGGTSIYGCEKCWFFIHTSCAISRQIQHPRHQHPLDLQLLDELDEWRFKDLYYRCVEFDRGCDFELRSGTAMRTLEVEKYYCSVLREDSDGESSTMQFAHEHPLTSFPARRTTSCGGCGVDISEEEEVYGCSECNIFLHEACAKAPLEIQHHPFHPKHPLFLFYDSSGNGECHACRSWSRIYIGYRCEECELIFDLSCVISTMPCEDDDDDERGDLKRRPSAIDHPLHPHRLSSYHMKTQTEIKCRNCDQRIPSGDFYGCSVCFFFLHESCARPPADAIQHYLHPERSCARPPADAIQHYLHPEHALTFAKHANVKRCSTCGLLVRRDSYCYYCKMYKSLVNHDCSSCGLQVEWGSYCYTCKMCDFFMHPICATATLSDLEEGWVMTVKYSFHEHELKLYYAFNASRSCTVCRETINKGTLAYRCFSQGCKFKIHKSCLLRPSELEHPSHSLHPLTFCFLPPNEDEDEDEDEYIACRGCCGRINGTFAFSCGECNFYLHLPCAQQPTLKHPFHEHHLFYFQMRTREIVGAKQNNIQCRACRRSCLIDFFVCAHCDFILHYDCSHLQLTIKSEHHWDPLVLRESYKEDDWGPYYCDICERRRDPNKWVYFCETCETDTNYFVAHVECALSRVKLEVIEEDDFIRQSEHIQKREEEIRVAQEQVDAKEVSLRPLMGELESMRSKLELQRVELKELKTEHVKWINMGATTEDESIGGEEDIDSTYGESETLRQILEELETQQANWLIKFLKRKRCLPSDFSP